jgi:hypothetical protein
MARFVGGIKLAGEKGISRIDTGRNATLSTTNPTDAVLGFEPWLMQ